MEVSKTYNLKIKNPGLASQWHLVRNGDLTPEDVTPLTVKKVWWICKKGHEWREKVYLQDRREGCPLCHKNKTNQQKSQKKFVSKSFRGLFKPIVSETKGGSSFMVTTTLDKKTTRYYKGKILEQRDTTSYARYVYGLDRIPEGWVIWHKDGDPLNNNIENLECISKSELARRVLRNRYKT